MAAIYDPDRTLNLNELAEGVKKSLPTYARPLFVRVLSDLPMTGNQRCRCQLYIFAVPVKQRIKKYHLRIEFKQNKKIKLVLFLFIKINFIKNVNKFWSTLKKFWKVGKNLKNCRVLKINYLKVSTVSCKWYGLLFNLECEYFCHQVLLT